MEINKFMQFLRNNNQSNVTKNSPNNKTHSMTEGDKLLIYPWEQRRYEQHREKVRSAKAVIDRSPPTFYPHILQKAKKQQSEKERILSVENENVRLLQRLSNIMSSKRMSDFWREPRPNFLNREKIFEVRPHTAHVNWKPLEGLEETLQKSSKGRKIRCPTCKGQPERPKIIIPEERIPWQPPRLSFNVKSLSNRKFEIRSALTS